MTTTKSTSKSSGCGGGAGCGCGCGCGGTTFPGRPVSAGVCAPCEEAAFVRPRFFAGQLLTEDDLEALSAYVIGKNRLHSSRLFGDGVVCGFEVLCGPCGGGTIIVKPGYALDCCGNDLVLECDRELDIGPMIGALREQLRPGHGCADPCVGEQPAPEPCVDPEDGGDGDGEPAPALVQGSTERGLAAGAKPGHGKRTRAADEYCLYVRYAERPTEPTTPYPVGDDCATGGCEATRIVEGVTFELRCRPAEEEWDDAFARIVRMLDQLSPDGRTMKELGFLSYTARTAHPALRRLEAGKPEVSDQERATWQAWLDRIPTAETGERGGAEKPRIELLSGFAVEVGGVSLRAQAQQEKSSRKGRDTLPDPQRTGELIEEARKTLAGPPTEGEPAIVTAGRQAVGLYESLSTGAQRRSSFDQFSPAQQLYLYGWAHGPAVHRRLSRGIRDVQRAVIRAINCGGWQSDCLVRDAVATLPVFRNEIEEVAIDDVVAVVRSARSLSTSTHGYVRDQACLALLPPCAPCDDPGVLLACIKVVGCKVVEICNLERKFVWSPTAVRHWLPPLTWLGAAIEEACCGGDLADVADAVEQKVGKRIASLQKLVEAPGVGSLAEVAHRFYAGAPHPRLLADALSPLVSLGRPAAAAAAVAPQTEAFVSRAEFDSVVAGLKADLAQAQAGGKAGKGKARDTE